eukprot:6068265-Prymnesium_polylepis.1
MTDGHAFSILREFRPNFSQVSPHDCCIVGCPCTLGGTGFRVLEYIPGACVGKLPGFWIGFV